jgi:hypothetical protein
VTHSFRSQSYLLIEVLDDGVNNTAIHGFLVKPSDDMTCASTCAIALAFDQDEPLGYGF